MFQVGKNIISDDMDKNLTSFASSLGDRVFVLISKSENESLVDIWVMFTKVK